MIRDKILKKFLNECVKVDAVYQLRYIDYGIGEYTVPVKLTPERIERIVGDHSVFEIKISIKP